jgi:hypothetical protein
LQQPDQVAYGALGRILFQLPRNRLDRLIYNLRNVQLLCVFFFSLRPVPSRQPFSARLLPDRKLTSRSADLSRGKKQLTDKKGNRVAQSP